MAAQALYAAFVLTLRAAGRRQDARALVEFMPDCVALFRRLLSDDRVRPRRKLLLAAMIGYLALALDLVPDFIPVAGQLNDASIVALVLRAVLRVRHVKPSKFDRARVIPIGDGLGRVIGQIIRHVKAFYGTGEVPACDGWDSREKQAGPHAPYLLQGAGHPSQIAYGKIRSHFARLPRAAGAGAATAASWCCARTTAGACSPPSISPTTRRSTSSRRCSATPHRTR